MKNNSSKQSQTNNKNIINVIWLKAKEIIDEISSLFKMSDVAMLENTVRQKYLYCKQSCSSCSVFKRNTKG
jgi:hypothetical protein